MVRWNFFGGFGFDRFVQQRIKWFADSFDFCDTKRFKYLFQLLFDIQNSSDPIIIFEMFGQMSGSAAKVVEDWG